MKPRGLKRELYTSEHVCVNIEILGRWQKLLIYYCHGLNAIFTYLEDHYIIQVPTRHLYLGHGPEPITLSTWTQ